MEISINKKILSFREILPYALDAEKSVILLRHSMRQTLNNGSDPGLTPEGTAYALQCGTLLAGLSETAFGASPRKRTVETARSLQIGGGFPQTEIKVYPEIRDTSLFTHEDNLDIAIKEGKVAEILQEYFTTGKAGGMIDLDTYSAQLLQFLTGNVFEQRNTILLAHDIVCASLMLPLKIYPFKMDDWCGYIQGASLFLNRGKWHIFYTVPDAEKREKYALFV